MPPPAILANFSYRTIDLPAFKTIILSIPPTKGRRREALRGRGGMRRSRARRKTRLLAPERRRPPPGGTKTPCEELADTECFGLDEASVESAARRWKTPPRRAGRRPRFVMNGARYRTKTVAPPGAPSPLLYAGADSPGPPGCGDFRKAGHPGPGQTTGAAKLCALRSLIRRSHAQRGVSKDKADTSASSVETRPAAAPQDEGKRGAV